MKNLLIYRYLFTLLFGAAFALFFSGCEQSDKVRAVIITGQNNFHNWEVSSQNLETILSKAGIFDVDVVVSPGMGADMSGFKPEFSKYQVVVLDYDGDSWPESTRQAFAQYVENGGGVVVYHASNNAFPDWVEYNEIIGFGGWGGRDEAAGPLVYWEDGKVVKDDTPGEAGAHGERHPFKVVMRDNDHPITKGLPSSWMHTEDEIYGKMRGPANDIHVLATAYDDTTFNGGGHDEIVMLTLKYGQGRIFHTTLGHAGKNAEEFPAMHCAGFITIMQRGTEWAATGAVTQEVPAEFPNSVSTVLWEDFEPLTLEELMQRVARYKIGQSRKYLSDLSNRIRKGDGNTQTYLMYEERLLDLLQSDATSDSKKYACRELSWMGSEKSVQVLEGMLEDESLDGMAAYALQRLSPPVTQ